MHQPNSMQHPTPGTPALAPSVAPEAQCAQDPEATFHFHPRASNPELWRTSLPLVVSLRCAFHKGLIATWMAIHWLMVLHAGNGCGSFSMRAIAQKANVGRNELAGKHGYIQRLVQLGLLHIVGYQHFPGLHEPRPIYQIDLAELERLSIESVPEVLRQHNLPPPPRPAPDPRQLRLFDDEAPTPENGPADRLVFPGTPENGPAMYQYGPGIQRAMPENGPAMPPTMPADRLVSPAMPPTMPADRLIPPATPENGPGIQRATPENGPAMHQYGPGIQQATPENRPAMAPNKPTDARKRDVEREKEGEKERECVDAPTPALNFQQLSAAIAEIVIATLYRQGILPTHANPVDDPGNLSQTKPSDDPGNPTPTNQPPLPSTVWALWQGDEPHLLQRDRHQIQLLISKYDLRTDGYGAYWVGRAILLADTCLREKGRALTLAYVRSILTRWEQEASWGSDLATEPLPISRPLAPKGRAAPPTTPEPPATPPAPSSPPTPPLAAAHPALATYTAAFGRTPNAVQSAQIVATVSDLALWQRVLTEWQVNDWQAGAVGKMLDRYRKEAGLVSPAEPERPPSVGVIHHYPGLTLDERELWIRRFHRAETPAAKRAVLARLAQEHPREGMKDER